MAETPYICVYEWELRGRVSIEILKHEKSGSYVKSGTCLSENLKVRTRLLYW